MHAPTRVLTTPLSRILKTLIRPIDRQQKAWPEKDAASKSETLAGGWVGTPASVTFRNDAQNGGDTLVEHRGQGITEFGRTVPAEFLVGRLARARANTVWWWWQGAGRYEHPEPGRLLSRSRRFFDRHLGFLVGIACGRSAQSGTALELIEIDLQLLRQRSPRTTNA